MGENKKNLEVVTGDGSDLDISPVYNHLSAEKPQTNNKKPKNIVIPKPHRKDKNINKKET